MSAIMKKAFSNENWSKAADQYERSAGAFVSFWANDALHFAHQRVLDVAESRVGSATFVDVGCGTGILCLAFAEKYLAPKPARVAITNAEKSLQATQIVATDLADGMLAYVDDKLDNIPHFQQYRSQIKTMQMDGQLLDKLEDDSADIVGSSFGLSIFPDREKAWRSAARVLRDGGLLFATVWDAQSPNLIMIDGCAKLAHEAQLAKTPAVDTDSREAPRRFVSPSAKIGQDSIADELKAAGFRDIEMYRTRHSVMSSSPSLFVTSMVDNPGFSGFVELAGRECLEDYLYSVLAADGGFATDLENERHGSPPSFDELKKSTRPVTLDFIGHVIIASKSASSR
ncbi:hypothetical protein PybrP1_010005 [[Pythium] brassicae (nom. inval.)]|nr:hypothetical protein PybrP1_010005 [[Pythium] brassicae (nom. inval.)]